MHDLAAIECKKEAIYLHFLCIPLLSSHHRCPEGTRHTLMKITITFVNTGPFIVTHGHTLLCALFVFFCALFTVSLASETTVLWLQMH